MYLWVSKPDFAVFRVDLGPLGLGLACYFVFIIMNLWVLNLAIVKLLVFIVSDPIADLRAFIVLEVTGADDKWYATGLSVLEFAETRRRPIAAAPLVRDLWTCLLYTSPSPRDRG